MTRYACSSLTPRSYSRTTPGCVMRRTISYSCRKRRKDWSASLSRCWSRATFSTPALRRARSQPGTDPRSARLRVGGCGGSRGIKAPLKRCAASAPAAVRQLAWAMPCFSAAAVSTAISSSCSILSRASMRGRHDLLLLAAGTDGTDGATLDAGALVDGETCARIALAELDVEQCLNKPTRQRRSPARATSFTQVPPAERRRPRDRRQCGP